MRVLKLVVRKVFDVLKSVVYGPDLPGGINDEALPSGFLFPHKKGSRQVRNLGHIDF
jgi:hypothetical protein